jgi:glutathione peroxidase-family protein
MSTFHGLEMKSIDGELVKFDGFEGQYCLVVNVASR